MGQQVGLKVQLAKDFGKLSPVGIGAVIQLSNRVDELEKENKQLKVFHDQITSMYGQGLEVANYHLNDTLEPLDTFIDYALEEMEETK